MRTIIALVLVTLVVTACSRRSSEPETDPASSFFVPTTASRAEAPGSTQDSTRADELAEPDLTLRVEGFSPHLPVAMGPDAVVSYIPPVIVTHAEAKTTQVDVTAVAAEIGDRFDISSILWWSDRFWAFLIGDVSTRVGVASALTSPDGVTWERVEVGSAAGGARLPGAFATPDVPQYEGSSGVQAAAATQDRLIVGGWTRTEAGVQPVVWVTDDGQSWSVEMPPSATDRGMAVTVAPGEAEILVHVLGPFYFGQDMWLLSDEEPIDVSLVGDQYVLDVVQSGDGFVLSTSAFGAPPTGLWEWDGTAWQSIAAPDIAPRSGDGSDIEPFRLEGSGRGAVITGDREVALRRDGGWAKIGSVRGSIVDAAAFEDRVTVLSLERDDLHVTAIPMP